MNYDIAYCARTDCKYSDCIRHQSHVPVGVPVAMCYFDCPYERMTWQWVKDGDFLVCPNCESEVNIKNSLGVKNHNHYCHNCGARMDVTDINVGDKEGESHETKERGTEVS